MQPLDPKLKTILGVNDPWYFRFIDFYLERPIISDIVLSMFVLVIKYLLFMTKKSFFGFEVSSLTDILNELISSALAAGGFVLAALAIIASIKQSVPEIPKGEKPKNGKEYFYNSIGYQNIVKMYSIACLVFLAAFLYFVFIRATAPTYSGSTLLNLVLFGTAMLSLTFLRCVVVLWSIIKI